MANTNNNLHQAKRDKNDEFYTTYEAIQDELNHYEDKFRDKVVLCNCDDPFESNFCKFFLLNFNYLGLKRLICTSYNLSPFAGEEMECWHQDVEIEDRHGFILDVSEVPMANGRGVSDQDIDNLLHNTDCVHALQGDGDFRSEECIEYLKQADIVVTNPPFSLFREYVAQLIEYGKEFLIIGSQNAITYKDIFALIKDNQLWLGEGFKNGNAFFKTPYPELYSDAVNQGNNIVKFRNCNWFTNLDHDKRHEKLILFRKYHGNEDCYPKYDNYDAINVNKVADIPCDYDGTMGVPITFLDKYNPEQFKIIKFRKGNDEKDLTINGKPPYFRILIQKI